MAPGEKSRSRRPETGSFLGGFSVLMFCWHKWCKHWEEAQKFCASCRCWETFNLCAAPAFSAALFNAGGNKLEELVFVPGVGKVPRSLVPAVLDFVASD